MCSVLVAYLLEPGRDFCSHYDICRNFKTFLNGLTVQEISNELFKKFRMVLTT